MLTSIFKGIAGLGSDLYELTASAGNEILDIPNAMSEGWKDGAIIDTQEYKNRIAAEGKLNPKAVEDAKDFTKKHVSAVDGVEPVMVKNVIETNIEMSMAEENELLKAQIAILEAMKVETTQKIEE